MKNEKPKIWRSPDGTNISVSNDKPLSSKRVYFNIHKKAWRYGYWVEDVKEAVQRLKEELRFTELGEESYNLEVIDNIFGEAEE